ncbi:hypothetical protein ACWJJH_03275 [Endozoicomonadaceae bacterium StTr2]
MMRNIPVLSLLLTLASIPAAAAEVDLDTAEIEQLLSGNTISGVHYQKQTNQYFSESGLTLWAAETDKAPSEGQWKAENNRYCSDFGSGWNCYKIVNDSKQGIYYFLGDDFRAPFIVRQGYHFQLKLH